MTNEQANELFMKVMRYFKDTRFGDGEFINMYLAEFEKMEYELGAKAVDLIIKKSKYLMCPMLSVFIEEYKALRIDLKLESQDQYEKPKEIICHFCKDIGVVLMPEIINGHRYEFAYACHLCKKGSESLYDGQNRAKRKSKYKIEYFNKHFDVDTDKIIAEEIFKK